MGKETEIIKFIFDKLEPGVLYQELKKKDIIPQRLEIYSDFVETLYTLIFTTYLGEDTINTTENKIIHFNWCWNKVKENFKLENISFNDDLKLKEMFYNFTINNFFDKEKSDENEARIFIYWKMLLNYHTPKTQMELEEMFNFYEKFDECFSLIQA